MIGQPVTYMLDVNSSNLLKSLIARLARPIVAKFPL